LVKTGSKTVLMLGLLVGMALAGTAFADAGGGNLTDGTDNGIGNGGVNNGGGNGGGNNGGGNNTPPAAPEPGQMLMAAAGVMLVGGYILWRRNRVAQVVR
jgi:hypothetical protein